MKFRRTESESTREIPDALMETLNQLDEEAIILAPGEVPIFATDGAEVLGILRDGKVQSTELIALIRVVRRTNEAQSGNLSVPRGPIGEGLHQLTVKVIPLPGALNILVLLSDETEIERVNQVRRDFVANISHELKTPIGALSLLSEAILSAKDEPEAVVKFAQRMQIESKRLTELVQEIINLSRLQDSDPLQEAENLSMNALIYEAIDQCQTTADGRRIWIEFTSSEDQQLFGNREQLTMAIHNLIENAVNYSSPGTKVSITTSIEDGICEISIADQGIGIPESELERIFERFYRVDPARSRETGGTGLGLSIVKHVISNHGGELKVWSSEGVGSTFAIRLPVSQTTSDSEAK